MNIVKKSLVAGSLAMAVSVVAYFEGISFPAYLDPVGIPTICYGHTATAKLGQTKTEAECQALLQQDLGAALDAVDKHLPNIPPATRAALGSFVYNVGTGNFQSSTLLRKAKAGDLVGACNELPRWVYAKGQKLNGLVRRREAERQLCLEGLSNDKDSDKRHRGPVAVRGLALVAAR
ncbi:MAG: lysozyme [Pseudomonas sp.]|nr:lysozyme [Pseudomonas sp.]